MICRALWLKGQGQSRTYPTTLSLSRWGVTMTQTSPLATREKHTLSWESVEAGSRLIVLGRNSYRL